MLTIGAVTVDGFRGFPKEVTVDFDCPVTLLVAENHQGKSSLLNAIEWCLFGDDCTGAATGIRERVGWEVVNRTSKTARIRLTLVDGDRSWVIERRQKHGSKKGQSLALSYPDGKRVEGSAATQELASLIKLNYRDFFCTAYQHQESIRGALTQEPRERNDAFDRLLGLSSYRNVLDALRQAKVADVQKQMLSSLEVFQAKVQTALSTRRKDLAEKKGEAAQYGLTESDFTEAQVILRCSDAAAEIGLVAAELTVVAPTLERVSEWAEVKRFCAAADAVLASLLRQAPEAKVQQQLLTSRDHVVRARTACECALQATETTRGKMQRFVEDNGTRETIEASIVIEKQSIAEKEEQMRAASPKAKIVEEGIALLENAGLGTGKELCPLCGHEVEELLIHLKTEWQQHLERQIAQLQTARKQHELDLSGWKDKLVQFVNLEREQKHGQAALDDAIRAAATALGCTLSSGDDPIALCSQRVKEVDAALQQAASALKSRQDRVDGVRVRLAALLAVFDVLALQTRIDALDEICDCSLFREMEDLRDQMASLVDDVDAIQNAVRDASGQEAGLKITAAQAAVKRYFLAMSENPSVQNLELKVEQKSNGNDYRVLDADGQELTPILSQGDLNCLALALFFGMAEVRGQNQGLSLIMLDDPSQSLGEGHMRRLVNVLNLITATKPAVLATMDVSFGQMLREGLLKKKAIHQLRDWTPQEGPQITRLTGVARATVQ